GSNPAPATNLDFSARITGTRSCLFGVDARVFLTSTAEVAIWLMAGRCESRALGQDSLRSRAWFLPI
ncbi:MAG: hypothetical protein EBX64_03280, partial [Betaproteobacteria bacterium]|nr:hypothetical protein [Betaproteobacteria bacterium]